MRDAWYGDNRDVVKWGVLVRLADRFGAKHILQVLYHRTTRWGLINFDDAPSAEVPKCVIDHFRDCRGVARLTAPATVEIICEPFEARETYHQLVLDRIRSRRDVPGLVFLDPDTGLQPASPNLNHVLENEVVDIWEHLTLGDVLVLYQHQTNRNGDPWIPAKRQQLERALALAPDSVHVAKADTIARDVVLFYKQKA
jgi:hypothetical protein